MIRLALIGCGIMGSAHERQFHRLEGRLQVVATVDVDREKAERAKGVLGAKVATTDFRTVLSEVDAVLIAVPHHLHHPIGMECLAAGKHLLMEKPLANTEEECLDLLLAAEQQGVVFMVAYVQRYHPLSVRMGELIKAKTYGETFHVSMWTEQYTRVGDDLTSWHHRAATLGGGQFFSHGCHYVDLLLDYLGDPVEGTHIGTNFGTPWMEREGTSDAFIKFTSGAVGYHGGTWGARGTRLGYSFHAQATEAMLEVDQYKDVLILHQGGKQEVLMEGSGPGKYTDREMAHFLDCIERNERPLTDGWRSLQSLRVIWRLYEAERNKTIADLRGLGLSSADR